MTQSHDFEQLFAAWGCRIDPDLLDLALTHRSWAFEHDTGSNERLEFFGDSILGLIAVERIFTDYPHCDEGLMTKFKAASVSEHALAQVAEKISLGDFLKLGNGSEKNGDRRKPSILSDGVEALIAATYLTHGMETTRKIVERHLAPLIRSAVLAGPANDWRTSFEQLARRKGIEGTVSYRITGEGPDHARRYYATVILAGKEWGKGEASSQKTAKLAACENAYRHLENGVSLDGEWTDGR